MNHGSENITQNATLKRQTQKNIHSKSRTVEDDSNARPASRREGEEGEGGGTECPVAEHLPELKKVRLGSW